MQTIQKQKWPVLIAVLLVVAALVGNLLVTLLGSGESVEDSVTLGQQYLNEMNYSGAILEFTNAIELQPSNIEARMGLAQAYTATKDYQFAQQVLTDILDENHPDPRVSEGLLDVYEQSGDENASAGVLQDLIDQTDEDQYYEQMQEVLDRLFAAPHSYAAGTDQSLRLHDGNVTSRGSNTLGQLGTVNSLGQRGYDQTEYAAAGFDGAPLRVYCAGHTSYVLDSDHNLWAAGENRWGQMGLAYATTLPEGGWKQIVDTQDVAAVAGTVGSLYVLKIDGSLWYAGTQGEQVLRRVQGIACGIKLVAAGNTVYCLTSDGLIYGTVYGGSTLYRVASDVKDFSVDSSNTLTVLHRDGSLQPGYGYTLPEEWTWQEDGSFMTDLPVQNIAANTAVMLLDTGSDLYCLQNTGNLAALELPAAPAALYTENDSLVAELQDGTVLVWAPGETTYTEL